MTIESQAVSCCSPLCSTEEADERVRRNIVNCVTYFAEHPDEIEARLAALDAEWDLDRTLQVHAGAMVLGGMTLGLVSRKWRLLAFMAGAFLIARAFGGWCPGEMLWRRMGVRTQREIMLERCALKALHGDFQNVAAGGDPGERALRALKAAGLSDE